MSETSIQWTERTWNPIVGCSIKSPGCHHCYAATMAKRLRAMALADIAAGRDPGRKRHYIDAVDDDGHWTGKLIPVPEALADPIHWHKPRMVFVNSMSDLFHESVSFDFIDKVFAVMNATLFTLPADVQKSRLWHTYQILTKRPERMCEYMLSRSQKFEQGEHPIFNAGRGNGGVLRGMNDGGHIMNAGAVLSWPPPNVWLGCSVEDQKRADERIPHLLRCPAAVRFLSCEPLLGPVNLLNIGEYDGRPLSCLVNHPCVDKEPGGDGIDWVITGGESGHKSRPCDVAWIRDIIDQCQRAGVAVFNKQLGGNCVSMFDDNHGRTTGRVHLGDKAGADPAEWPADIRVREFPEVSA